MNPETIGLKPRNRETELQKPWNRPNQKPTAAVSENQEPPPTVSVSVLGQNRPKPPHAQPYKPDTPVNLLSSKKRINNGSIVEF